MLNHSKLRLRFQQQKHDRPIVQTMLDDYACPVKSCDFKSATKIKMEIHLDQWHRIQEKKKRK